MASYINKKDRVFFPAGDCPPQFHRQRPEACLKTYYSCTDTRVWELAEEPRRQHLREILSTPVGLQLGNYVPIEMLINILMCSDAEVCIKEKDYSSSVGYLRSNATNNEAVSCFCYNSSASRQIKTCGTQCPPMKSYTKDTVCCDQDKEIHKLTCQIEKLELDIKCTKKLNCEMEKQLCHMSTELKENNKEISEKNKEIISLKKDVCERHNEITSLKNELSQKCNEIQSLKTELCQKSNFPAESLKKLELLNRKYHDSECERKELERKNCEQQNVIRKFEEDCIKPSKMCDMQQELNKLREYCQFLSKAQEQAEKHSECLNTENQGLKKELRGCHQTLADQSGKLAELHSNADNLKHCLMEKDGEICRLKKDISSLQEEIRYQNCQLKDAMAKTPDKCNCTHNSAEEKARKYKQKFKELECQLRELSCACGKNKKDLQQMECLEKERNMLQRRVDELCSIEQAYNSLRNNQLCDMQNLIAERDMLRMKLLNMSTVEGEVERLRCKTKEMECLRAERNRFKQRTEELEAVEAQYIELLSVQKELEVVKCDRDRLKCKIEELMRQNYDKQRQICEMETELKQLIAQIDHMTEEECKQEMNKLRTQNECLVRRLDDKQQLLNHYAKKFEIINKTKDELKDVQDDIINSINDFNIQQQLNDNLYQFLSIEHKLNTEQIEAIIDYLTQLVACNCEDLSEIKCKIIQKISNLKSTLDINNHNFSLKVNDILNLNNYNHNDNIDMSRSIYGNVLDETHRQYNNEISKMEQIITKYENQIKSLQHLPLKVDRAQYTNLQPLKIDRIGQCISKQHVDQSQCIENDNSSFENDLTCMLLHEIEYKTSEIEHDEEELQQLRSNSMNSTFNSICEQINEIVIRCESEQNSIVHTDLNKQIIDLIQIIEHKRNEIDYIQNELNVFIKNNDNYEQIECNINEIIRLHDIIEITLHELNDLKIRVNISESTFHEDDQILRQIHLIQKEIQLKENKIHKLQLNLKRLSESDSNNIEIEDMDKLTRLINTLQNEIENDQNELKKLFDLASKDDGNDNKQSLANYLMSYFKKTDSMVTTLLRYDQTFNKYLSTVKKLKELVENNENKIKSLYRSLREKQGDHKFMLQTIDWINQLQNGINKYQNDILRILINIPTRVLHNIDCDDIKEYILTVQRLANENIKAYNDLNYLKQQQSLLKLGDNIDKLNEIDNKMNKIDQRVRKNREKIFTISTLLTLLPINEQRLPVHGEISSASSIKSDKYILSIRTLKELIEQNQIYATRLKDQKVQIAQDQMQYRNRVYHLQGVINKNMKEILKLIEFLPDEDILKAINDLQSKQLNIFNEYTKILKMLEQLTNNENIEIIQEIQDRIKNAQQQICYEKIRNILKQINEKCSINSRSTEIDIETSTIINDVCELLEKVEMAQRKLEHCAIHLSQILHSSQSKKHDSDKELEQIENEIGQFKNIITILERCKEIEENDGSDVGKYINEIQNLQQKVDQLKVKLDQSENMVVYMDAIKHLHAHIANLDQQNRMKSNIQLHQEMTMNYIQKLTHAVDKLHPSKKDESTSNSQQQNNIQIDIPKSVEDDRLEISSDIPFEVYNLQIDNEQLKTLQEDLLTQMRAVEDENNQYREDIDTLQLKYQNAIQDLQSCNTNSGNMISQYEDEINNLKEHIAFLRTQMETITEENVRLIQSNQNEQQNNHQQTVSTYSAEESVKKILSNQSQQQNYIEELEKRLENYTFIIQTIGTDGHFSHLFVMIGESIRTLEGKLREAYDQISLLRWNALVDENLTKMAKHCLKDMHEKLDETRNEATIRELMNTIRMLENQVQIIRKDSKMGGTSSHVYESERSFHQDSSTKYHSDEPGTTFKPAIQHTSGIAQMYADVDVQTASINLITGDAYIQTDKTIINRLSKNFVLEFDIGARNSECGSVFQLAGNEVSTVDSVIPDKITAAHVQIYTEKPNDKQIGKKYDKTVLSEPSRHLWSFKSMMQNDYKTTGNRANTGTFDTDPETSGCMPSSNVLSGSHNTIYSSPCTSQYVVHSGIFGSSDTTRPKRKTRHSVRGCTSQSVPAARIPLPVISTNQGYSYRGSPQRYIGGSQGLSRQTSGNLRDIDLPNNSTHIVNNFSKLHAACSNRSSSRPSSAIERTRQMDRSSSRSIHIHSDSVNSENSEFISQMKHLITVPVSSPNQNLTAVRGSRINRNDSNKFEYPKNHSLRGASTTVDGIIYYQEEHTSQVLDHTQHQSSTHTLVRNCATLRGTFLNHQHGHHHHHHNHQRDVYSLRGAPRHNHGIRGNEDRSYAIPAQNFYTSISNKDPVDLQRYINVGGLYSVQKDSSKEKPAFNVEDQVGLKYSLTYSDTGVDDTPLRRHSTAHIEYPLMDAFNEVITLRHKLADFEDKAAQNLANLKKQYERNAKSLIAEHNKSVSKLSFMQDETVRQLENENDKLRDQIHHLLKKLMIHDKNIQKLSSASTGEIDIPPSHTTMHLQNKQVINKSEDNQNLLENVTNGSDKNAYDNKKICDPKRVSICVKSICFHDDVSCTGSCLAACDGCPECIADCDEECVCVSFADKAIQTKPMARAKIAATRSMANILSKFLYEGLQRLDIFELSKLHARVCYAAQTLIEEEKEKKMSQEEKIIHQINKMEDKLIRKQKSAQEKLKFLELCMHQEKHKICNMRAEIITEKLALVPCSDKSTEDLHVCHSTQANILEDCTCNASLQPCASDPCKQPELILKTCSEPCKPKSVSLCTEPCTTNLSLSCTPEAFPECISTRMLEDGPCKPKSILKGCFPSPKPCRNRKIQKESCDQCGPLITCKSSKSTSVLCQFATTFKNSNLTCGPRSTSVLCGLPKLCDQSTTTPDYDKCAGILPISRLKFPYSRVPTKYQIEDKPKEDKPKECICSKKGTSRPGSTRTCCGCRDGNINELPSKSKKTPKVLNYDFLAKCAPSLYKSLNKQKS